MKQCVITGAADGIGKALAQRFAAAGYAITGIDVDAERATQTQAELLAQSAQVQFIHANLAEAEAIERVLAQLAALPPIDVFIHNAGINAVGSFARSAMARQNAVLDVNLLAPLLLTQGLLARQRMAARGSFVFIASLSVFASYPGAAVYGASKDGIAAYARSLRVVLAREGKHVLCVFPGPTRTAHARRYSPDNSREHLRMPPATLAAQIYAAVQKRKPTLVPGVGNRLFASLCFWFPLVGEWAMRKTIWEKLEAKP